MRSSGGGEARGLWGSSPKSKIEGGRAPPLSSCVLWVYTYRPLNAVLGLQSFLTENAGTTSFALPFVGHAHLVHDLTSNMVLISALDH